MDVASYKSGCRVLSATSRDEIHPATHILDGDEATFWCSTGLFPHEFIFQFDSIASISGIKIKCSDVKSIMIEKTDNDDVNDFQPLAYETLPMISYGGIQNHTFELQPTIARHLRFIIKSGYSNFVSFHTISVDGKFLVRTDRPT